MSPNQSGKSPIRHVRSSGRGKYTVGSSETNRKKNAVKRGRGGDGTVVGAGRKRQLSVGGKNKAQKTEIDREELAAAIVQLRPALQVHGGDLEVIAVAGNEVTVRLSGACHGCPMAQITLSQGVEKFLLKRVKGLKRVKAG